MFIFVFWAGIDMVMSMFTVANSFSLPFSLNPDCTGNTFTGRKISAAFGLRFFSMTDAEVHDFVFRAG